MHQLHALLLLRFFCGQQPLFLSFDQLLIEPVDEQPEQPLLQHLKALAERVSRFLRLLQFYPALDLAEQ